MWKSINCLNIYIVLYQTESSHQNAHTLFKIESFPALRELFDQVFEVSSEIALPQPHVIYGFCTQIIGINNFCQRTHKLF